MMKLNDLFIHDDDFRAIDTEIKRLEAAPYVFPGSSKRAEKLDLLRHIYVFCLAGSGTYAAMKSWTDIHKSELNPIQYLRPAVEADTVDFETE